jgi:hypothetical protein
MLKSQLGCPRARATADEIHSPRGVRSVKFAEKDERELVHALSKLRPVNAPRYRTSGM